MDIKLSNLQEKTLERMRLGKWYSAYDLRVNNATMMALADRGYIKKSNYTMKNFGAEDISIEWRRIGE